KSPFAWCALPLRLCLRGHGCVLCGQLVVAPLALAGRGVMPELRQLLVEGFDRIGASLQQVVDKSLFSVFHGLLFQKKLFDGVGWLFVRHSDFPFYGNYLIQGQPLGESADADRALLAASRLKPSARSPSHPKRCLGPSR